MRIYATTENVYNAVDAVIKQGFAVISGTKTPVESYAVRIKKCLKPYKEIDPNLSLHKDIPHHGYLYYVYDMNRFSHTDLENVVREIGLKNSN